MQRTQPEPQEPVGIIINAGGREDVAPRFVAFVWGPAPEDDAHLLPADAKAA